MLEYKRVTDLTDDELSEILHIIFPKMTEFAVFKRHEDDNEVVVHVTVSYDDGWDGMKDIGDTVTLGDASVKYCIDTILTVGKSGIGKYRQWMTAHGCLEYLKDNPYLIQKG